MKVCYLFDWKDFYSSKVKVKLSKVKVYPKFFTDWCYKRK